MEPTTPVMFLGGPLDHAVRQVVARPGASPRPAHDLYLAPVRSNSNDLLQYRLRLVSAGPYRWWVYIAEGYTPSSQHLIDAAPTATFKEAT